jgi:Protein of unknown function (DUF3987)
MTDLHDMARAVLDDFYAVLDDPDATELAKLQATTDAVAGIDGYDEDGRIRDVVSNYAIGSKLLADKVQAAVVAGLEHAQLAREYRDQRPPLKPNGAIHQARNGALREIPSAKGEPLHTWEQPDWSLLEDRRGELPEFPIDVLSAGWQAWALETSHGSGTTPAHVVVPLLGIASGIVGVARRVQISRSWIEPIAMWTAVVGSSGTGKTPGIDASKRALALIEKTRRTKIEEQKRAHDERVDVAKIALKAWKKQVEEAAKKGGPRPKKPKDAEDPGIFVPPRLYVSDTTIERIAMLLEVRPCGLLLLADELSGLFLNMGRYNSGRDNEFWLEAWNGKSFLQERVGRKPISVDHLIVGVTGGLQPDKLSRSFDGDLDGMYARILFAWPDEPPYKELTDLIAEVEPKIVNALTQLVRMGDPDEDGTFAPRNIVMSTIGREVFETLRQRVFAGKAELDGRERDWWAKVPAHVARLAGTLTLLDWALAAIPSARNGWDTLDDALVEPAEIDAAHVKAAVRLVLEYFWPHARASLRQIGLTERHANSRRVLRWLKTKRLDSISRENVRRHALAQSLDADGTQALLEDIERAGWIRKLDEKRAGAGRPAMRWQVNPQLLDDAER